MIRIGAWERGFAFWPAEQADLRIYLWFYEWHLFDAVSPGEHTMGYWHPSRSIAADHASGQLAHPGMTLTAAAAGDIVELTLSITNESAHDWPEAAGIIPCLSPGGESGGAYVVPPTRDLFDDEHARTWYVTGRGWQLLRNRDIHFNERLWPALDQWSPDGQFVFSDKWPTSSENAAAGLVLRQSVGGHWVAGIAWEDTVSVQAHNPWRCMHLAVRVGPLARGQSRQVRGLVFVTRGSKEACLEVCRERWG